MRKIFKNKSKYSLPFRKNYKHAILDNQLNPPISKKIERTTNIYEDITEYVHLPSHSHTPFILDNSSFDKDKVKEIKASAKMYLVQLEKQLQQLLLVAEINPLTQFDMLNNSIEMFKVSIDRIQYFIDTNSIEELSKLV